MSCVTSRVPIDATNCKIRTYLNETVVDYISARYGTEIPVRIGVIPFDVPESFSVGGSGMNSYGHDLARLFVDEFHRTKALGIVELFARDRWPGKREDFASGNYQAIQLARNAGYDFVMVGYLENLRNDEDLTLNTKIIDISNQFTVWNAQTNVYSYARSIRKTLAPSLLVDDRPDLFAFPERSARLAECTVQRIVSVKQSDIE